MAHIDFFQRLTKTFGGASSLSAGSVGFMGVPKQRTASVYLQPTMLSTRFMRAWDAIVLDYEMESNWTRHVQDTDIVRNLNILVDILVKEHAVLDDGVVSGGCTERFLGEDMMSKLVAFSAADVPLGFRRETITFLTNLLLVLDPQILIHNAIHRPLLTLIEEGLQSGKYDKELLQLELDICGKIYDYPQLLQIFFSESRVLGKSNTGNITFEVGSPALITGHEFLLFDHITRFLHHEGTAGDFAREGALFLVELAAGDLAEYINASEFSAVATAGLGGVFSQLPSKVPAGISWGESFRSRSIGNAIRSARPIEAFRADVEALLRVLNFVQAVVIRCPDEDITVSLLEDFQCTFLDNIVQSSLTSASDFDGTTVSSLFYVQKMLEVLKEESMIAMMLQFLLSSDFDDDVEDEAKKKAMRKSMHRRSMRPASIMNKPMLLVPIPNDKKEMRLHVRDILVSKLSSLSEEVVVAVLNLFKIILANHPDQSLHLVVEKLPQADTIRRALAALGSTDSVILEEAEIEANSPTSLSSITASPSSFTIRVSIQTHLWMLARYFALVPAENPNRQPIGQPQKKIQPATSNNPFDLFSMMDSFVGSGLDNSTQAFGSMVAGPNGLVPVETTLASYIAAADRILGDEKDRKESVGPRAKIDLEELLLLGAAGSSKGFDADRRRKKKAKANIALNAILGDGEEVGVLKKGSIERNAMLELTKDTMLKKLLDSLSEFFSHSYAINLALTGVLSQLVAAKSPLLYLYLFSADILLGPRGVVAPLTPTHCLYTILLQLRREVEDRRRSTANFDMNLNVAREEMFGLRRRAPEPVVKFFGGMDEFDNEFYKNIVLLEEFTKELIAIFVTHSNRDYDSISYIS